MAENIGRRSAWYELFYIIILAVLLGISMYSLMMPRVAVVDLRRVAQIAGVDARISADVARWRNEASARIDEVRENLRKESDDLIGQIEKAGDEAEKNKLRERIMASQRVAQESFDKIKLDLQRRSEELSRAFRAGVEPTIREIARKRRLHVVIEAGAPQAVLYVHRRADITEAVGDAARSVFPPNMPLTGAPALEERSPAAEER